MLEGRGVLGRETHVREGAETRRHAIDDGPGFQSRHYYLPGGIDSFKDVVAHRRPGAHRDRDDVPDP